MLYYSVTDWVCESGGKRFRILERKLLIACVLIVTKFLIVVSD